MEWFNNLQWWEHVYLWLGVASTLFLIVQIIMMCFSSFGGDVDVDGDGDIDVDTDSGVSIFTVKSITAFLAVGSWAGLLTCALASDSLQWLSLIVFLVAGAAAMALVIVLMRAILKLQSDGSLDTEKLTGNRASVYVAVPPARSGHGKITLTAQGRYIELDAVTDESEKLNYGDEVEIVSAENDCAVVKRITLAAAEHKGAENKEAATTSADGLNANGLNAEVANTNGSNADVTDGKNS